MPRTTSLILALLIAFPALAADDEILAIQVADLPKLWTKTAGPRENEYYSRLQLRAGCATVSWIVEGDGSTSTIKVLKSWPDRKFGETTTDLLREWRYEPTADNPKRQAVFVVDTLVSTMAQADEELGTHVRRRVEWREVAVNCAIRGVNFGESGD